MKGAVAVLLGALSAHAAEPVRSMAAVRRTGDINLDGRADEPAWAAAAVASGFTQLAPDEGKPATVQTRARILWDDDSLWVAVDCDDPEPPTLLVNRRDRAVEADAVSVVLDTTLDRRTAYRFTVYAAGQQLDGMHFDDTAFNTEWDGAWESAVARTPQGWSAELRIPLRLLRLGGRVEQMGIDVVRVLARRHEESHWQFTPRGVPGVVSRLGRLTGLGGLEPVAALELKPYLAARLAVQRPAAADVAAPFRFGGCSSLGASPTTAGIGCGGLDVRASVARSLTLVGTLNPDFGSVEVDQRVLNLTTFETLFPEKRPFFLDGAELFQPAVRMNEWGGPYAGDAFQLFYSRRIGRALGSPALDDGAALLYQPSAQPIAGAAKLVGSAGGASLAVLTSVEPRVYAQTSSPGGTTDRRVADAALASVLRAKVPLASAALAGVTATSRNPLAAPGARHAHAGAADLLLFDADRDFSLAAQLAGSLLSGGPRAVEADGTVLASGATGGAASIKLARDGGAVTGFLDADWISPQFSVNDLGFLRRANLFRSFAAVALKDLHPSRRWQKASVTLSAREIRDASLGTTLYRDVIVQPEITFNNFWTFLGDVVIVPARADDRELGDGTPLVQRGGWGGVLMVTSDPNRPFSASAAASLQRFAPASDLETSLTLTVRPASRLEGQLEVGTREVRREVRRIRGATTLPGEGAGPAPLAPDAAIAQERLYLLAPQSVRSVSAVLRATLALTPRLTLQSYAQLFTVGISHGDPLRAVVGPGKSPVRVDALTPALPGDAAPDADARLAGLDVNLILRWEWRLGSALYLVYAHHSEGAALARRGPLSFRDDVRLVGDGAARGDSLLVKFDLLGP